MGKAKGASFDPETFAEGGGFLNGVEVAFTECKFGLNDYAGTQDPSPAFCATLVPDEGDPVTQFWSTGSAAEWEPSADGMEMVPVGKATGFRKSCNFAKLVASMVAAGFPPAKLKDSTASLFEGMRAVIVQVPQTDFDGKPKKRTGKDGRQYDQTLPLIDKIMKMPWEGASKKGASTPKGGAGKKKDEPGDADVDLDGVATEAIMGVLENAPKGMKKMQLIGAVFTHLKKQGVGMPEINAVTRHIKDSDVLANGPWEYKDDVVKAG